MSFLQEIPTAFIAAYIFIFGLVFGSFLNVVIYRVPQGRSLNGRSHCPKCNEQIKAQDNIPVLSWLFLKGKCRHCSGAISIRYPAIELSHALIWCGLTVWNGVNLLLPLLLFLASTTLALAMIDFDTMRLPDALTLPSLVVTLAWLALIAWHGDQWNQYGRALLGALIYLGFFLFIYLATKGRGLGFGDVKLAPTLGAIIGWFSLGATAVGIMGAFILGAIPAALLLASGIVKKGTPIPFGPMLIIGAWAGVVLGPELWNSYSQLMH